MNPIQTEHALCIVGVSYNIIWEKVRGEDFEWCEDAGSSLWGMLDGVTKFLIQGHSEVWCLHSNASKCCGLWSVDNVWDEWCKTILYVASVIGKPGLSLWHNLEWLGDEVQVGVGEFVSRMLWRPFLTLVNFGTENRASSEKACEGLDERTVESIFTSVVSRGWATWSPVMALSLVLSDKSVTVSRVVWDGSRYLKHFWVNKICEIRHQETHLRSHAPLLVIHSPYTQPPEVLKSWRGWYWMHPEKRGFFKRNLMYSIGSL